MIKKKKVECFNDFFLIFDFPIAFIEIMLEMSKIDMLTNRYKIPLFLYLLNVILKFTCSLRLSFGQK